MAIEELGAERIGHGIFAARDPAVLELARERQVLFELCPTSNWLTSSVPSIREHPIRKFMQAGVDVSINSDDPGLFDIDLCHEYRVLERELEFTLAEFNRCNDLAAAHSFVPDEIKQKVWPRPIPQAGMMEALPARLSLRVKPGRRLYGSEVRVEGDANHARLVVEAGEVVEVDPALHVFLVRDVASVGGQLVFAPR